MGLFVEALFCVQVFQPAFRDLPPPMLDLFDLDETFSSEKVRLAQLSNKCEFLAFVQRRF